VEGGQNVAVGAKLGGRPATFSLFSSLPLHYLLL
jgi:hypothetical protein